MHHHLNQDANKKHFQNKIIIYLNAFYLAKAFKI
jgi:hypothetical protein